MANNPYVNKVVFGNMTLIDTSNVTVTPDKLAEGYTALDASGALITGNIPSKSSSNLTASGATVTAPAGYYSTAATKTIDSGSTTQNAPTINSSTGLVTATATVTAGYQGAGTKSNTLQLATQAAQTITPGTTNQTIAAGKYLTGAQTIAGDSNLVAANIAEGVTIFGVTGTHSGGQSGGQIFIHDEVDPDSYDMTFTVNKSLVDNQNYIVYMWFRILNIYGRINGTLVNRNFENVALPVIIDSYGIYSEVSYERLVGADEFYNIYDDFTIPNPYVMYVELGFNDSEDSSTISYMINRPFGTYSYDPTPTRVMFQIDDFDVPEIYDHDDSGNFNCVLCFMPISSIPT